MIFLIWARAGFAQQLGQDQVQDARIHVGPLGLSPGIALANVGVDNNVFNEQVAPKQDFTFTVEPTLAMFMRTRRGLLSANGRLDFVYFNTFSSERSVDGFSELKYEYGFNRIQPFASFTALDTRDRPGYEIDARARRFENTLRFGVDSRIGSKGTVQLRIRRQTVAFAGDAVFLNQKLRNVLNRNLLEIASEFRQRLTVLTTFVISASREEERFLFMPDRNSRSVRLVGGFELGRFALIRGTAFAGYRKLKPSNGSVLPEFSGITTDVNVAYTSPTKTRLNLTTNRDLQYSFEVTTPYYVQTGWNIGLTQRVIGNWEAQLRGGQDHLSYRGQSNAVAKRSDRVDRVSAGVGYALGGDSTVGFTIESYFRNSNEPGHKYQSVRGFGSVKYDF